MIIWVPGADGMGQPTKSIMEFIDLYPTLLDFAGLEPPHELSGQTLRPVLDDPQTTIKDAAFTQVTRGDRMGYSVRTDRWRYIEWGKNGEFGSELYDHSKDTGEYFNLTENPEYSSYRKKLSDLLDQSFPSRRNSFH